VDANEYSPPAKTVEKRELLQRVIQPADRISGSDEIIRDNKFSFERNRIVHTEL
jgi:hypothetical protein